jgi:hypothetical protein
LRMTALAIPDEVVRMNVAVHGKAGRDWITALPALVEELSARWGLTLGPPFEGGCVGFVAPALRADGGQAVLKISLLDEENRHEGDALAFWAGDGVVRLLDADPGLGALLLERLEPGHRSRITRTGTKRSRSRAACSGVCGGLSRTPRGSLPRVTWSCGGARSCPSASIGWAAHSRRP